MIRKWIYYAMILIKMIYGHSLPSEIWIQVLLSYFGLNIKLLNNYTFHVLVNGFEERQNRKLMGTVHALIKNVIENRPFPIFVFVIRLCCSGILQQFTISEWKVPPTATSPWVLLETINYYQVQLRFVKHLRNDSK